jgi:hypothetical protein
LAVTPLIWKDGLVRWVASTVTATAGFAGGGGLMASIALTIAATIWLYSRSVGSSCPSGDRYQTTTRAPTPPTLAPSTAPAWSSSTASATAPGILVAIIAETLLSAPAINPVVLVATAVAFPGRPSSPHLDLHRVEQRKLHHPSR